MAPRAIGEEQTERRCEVDTRFSWKTYAVIAVLVAEIAGLGYVAYGTRTVPVQGAIVRPGAAAIEVADQSGPWKVLTVRRVVTPVPSWVVVQARQGASGRPGAVVGYTWVPSGVSTDVVVALDPGQGLANTFLVSVFADGGRRGVFEYAAPAAGGGGGGMMGGASSAPKSGSGAVAALSVDQPLVAAGRNVSVVVSEVFRSGAPGTVSRVSLGAPAPSVSPGG